MIEPLESRWMLAADWIEWARLLPTADGADTQHSGDGFGVSVAIDGDTAVVGALADGGERPLAGAAYVFTRDGSDWDLQQKLTASDAQFFDYFGYAVAISGETILVGALLHDGGGVSDSGAAYVFTRSAGVWTEQQKLVASDAGAEDRFGGFVAIDGDTAVVGAFGDDTAAGADAGSAYVFSRSGDVWAEQQKLTASDAAAGDSFGWGLALDGNSLIVGAYQKDLGSHSGAGAAYVYTHSDGVWSHQQTLIRATPAAGDGFGSSVALRGDTAVVGAYADDTAAIDAGSAFVFTRSGSTWTAVQQISAADAAAGDGFGVSVSIDADTIVVGSYQSDTTAGADAGAVYVFRESAGVWSQQQKLTASTAAAGDLLGLSVAVSGSTVLAGAFRADTPFGADSGAAYFFVDDGSTWNELQRVYQTDQDARGDTFGTAVAIDGTTMAVGAPQDNVAGINAGAAYVFTRTGTDWTLQQKLTAPGLQANDRFGWAIDVWGDTLVVAAPRHAVSSAAEAGAVFVFARTGDEWIYQQKLTASDAAANDWFGISLALGEGTLIVGAEGDDTAATGADAGSAYVFVVDGSGVWSQQQKLTAADGAAGDRFGNAVALDGDTVVVGAAEHNLFGWNDAGSAYVFVRSGTTWTEQQKLTAPVTYTGALFGSAVAIDGDQVLVGAEGVDVGFVPQAGAAHLFTRSGTQWSHQQQLSATDPGSFDRFGSAVAIGSDLLVIGANLRNSAVGSNVGSALVFTSSGGTWIQHQELTGRDQYAADTFGSSVAVSGPLVVVGAPLADLAGGNSGAVYVFAPDDTQPPTIVGTAPSLAANEVLDAGTRTLLVEFSEPVMGGGNAANYQLQSAGPDGLLGTVDDLILPLSVTYSGTTASLVFPALPESVYRLTVRDSITDVVGNPLDGNGSGLPGGDARLDFTVAPPAGGLFASSTEYLSGAYAFPRAIAAADFNGDGVVDLVTVNSTGNAALFLADGAGGFSLAGTFPTGGSAPWSVAVGDFNGDGHADLAVANTGSSSVGILLGNGAGGFAPAITYATGGFSPWYVTVGDFNGDGNDDLAVANTSSNSVGILLGDGAGGFAPAVSFATGGLSPRSVAVGDFNGDGFDDLAVANSVGNTVGILLGDGAGGFGAAVTYDSGGNSPRTVIAGDFNGDGKLDVAVTNFSSRRVGILLGDGAGGFVTTVTYDTVGGSPEGIVSGDFNGDGRADLAIGTNSGVAVLLGNETGGFNAAVVHATGGSQAKYVAVGDFNQDGNLDIAAAHVGSHNVGVVLGNGDGGFGAAVAYGPGGATPEAIASGDFNGDGIADLVTVNKDSGNVGVLLGDGAGGFAAAITYPTGGLSPRSVAVGDFNGDGIMDLAVANFGSNTIGILLGNGVGGFAPAVTFPAGGSSPTYVAVGDFNGDGRADLAVTRQGDHRVAIFLGDGTGGFSQSGTYQTGGDAPVGVAVSDFDGDGTLDLAIVNVVGNNVGILLGDGLGGFSTASTFNTGELSPNSVTVGDFNGNGTMDLAVVNSTNVGVLLGNGAGGFGAAVAYGTGGFTPKSVIAGDFNADGNVDLAVANSGSSGVGSNVGILLGNGSGGFGAAVPHGIGGSTPSALILGDFNADGHHDLAVANATSHNVSILLGRGASGLGAAITYGTGGSNPRAVAAGDFNNDGKSDLVIVNSISNNVGVLLGDGSGGFGTAITYGVGGSSPNAVAVGDFNLDGNTDVAYVRNATNNVGILLGNGAGGFTSHVIYPINGTNPRSIAVGDFNGDGKADLAIANQGSHSLSILLNNGSGGFHAPVTFGTGGTSPIAVTVGDFDGDGRADLAVTNSGNNTVGILFGDGVGGFSTAVAYPIGVSSPLSLVVGDFNGDGWDDLAIAGNEVSVLLGDGNGGFAPAVTYASGGSTAYQVSVGDFNADGKQDLAVVHYSSSNVGVLLGNGAGGFATATTYASGGVSPSALTVGDFNADGRDDLAATNLGSGNVGIFLNTSVYQPGAREFVSPHSMRFGVQTRGFGAGQLVEGSGGAFDGMGRLEVAGQTYAPTQLADSLTDGGRTVVTPTVVIGGLYVSRKITVPDSGNEDFARTVDVFTNPSSQPITTTVRIVGNLGSDAATTVWKTSSGDMIVQPTDQWIGTDDGDGSGTPAIVHYLHGPRGLVPTAASIGGDLGDNIEWTYEITVPAGETLRLAHFTILAETRAAAETAAAALVTPDSFGGQAAAHLSEDELASLVNFQFDAAPASLSAVLDGEGNLIVVDSDATGKDNRVTVRLNGADLVISDTSERFISIPDGSSLSDGDRTLTIPLALVTGSLVIDLAAGDDTLMLDFSGGNPIPAGGLDFHGGDPTGGSPGDTLVLDRGTSSGLFSTITHTLVNASDGSILLDPDGDGGASASVITYTGLEPIVDNLDAAHRVFSFTGDSETITLSDVGGPNGMSLIDSTLGESVTFANPTVSLTVDTTAGSGADAIDVEGLNAKFDADLFILADGDDTVRFQANPTDIGSGDLRVTAGNIRFTATVSTTGAARLEATSGSILGDPDGPQTDLVAATAELVATAGIGQLVGFSERAFQLSVERVEADSGAGVLFVYNDGPLIVGGVTAALNGIVVADHASIVADGNLTITEPIVDTVGDNHLFLGGHAVHINANILTGGSWLNVNTWNAGDLVLNAGIDSAGGDVYLVSDRDLIINGTLLTHGNWWTGLYAVGDISFTAESRVDAVVSPILGRPVFEVDAGGSVHMAEGALIDARDGQINLFADGDITISSLIATWFVAVVSRKGSILNGGDLYPNIISEAAELLTYDIGAVGTAANPLDLHVDELFGESFAGFYVRNAGPLDVAFYGIDAGGDVWIAADGPLNVTRPIRSRGSIAVSGVGESGSGADRFGIALTDLGQIVGPAISLIADSIDLPSDTSVDAGAGTVVLRTRTPGTLIDLGGGDVLAGTPLTLGLSTAELERIQAGTLTIGGSDSGELRITANVVRTAATDVTLVSGAGIVFDPGSIDTGGGTLVFDPGTAVRPLTAGTDAAAASVSFADGAALAIRIDGTVVDTGYSQLNVAGALDLTGAVLEISGSHVPAVGDAFTIVNNDGSDPVIGTFVGLPEGAVIANFLGSGSMATITYVGGDGNDVVLQHIGTRIDMTIVRVSSATEGNEKVAALPASADWVHEWESFWVEIWVSTPGTTTLGITEATVDLQYHSDYLTALEIEYGSAFTSNQTETIDDTLGVVSAIGGTTGSTDVGADGYVLLARVRFASTDDDAVPVDDVGRHIGPYDMQMVLADGQMKLVDAGAVVPELGASPETELWAVMYDMEDNHQIDFGALSFFAAAFGKTVGEPDSQPPYVWWADFDRSGRVDFGDLAFFAPNFGKTRDLVQAGEQTLVFPTNFPDAWRPTVGGGGEGEWQGQLLGGGPTLLPVSGAEGFARPTMTPMVGRATAVTDEAFAQLGDQGIERWTSSSRTGSGRQPDRSERPWRLTQLAPRWESLEDAVSLLAEAATVPLQDNVTPLRDALFARIGG